MPGNCRGPLYTISLDIDRRLYNDCQGELSYKNDSSIQGVKVSMHISGNAGQYIVHWNKPLDAEILILKKLQTLTNNMEFSLFFKALIQ